LGNIYICQVNITDQSAADILEKPIGKYITITSPPMYSSIPLSDDELLAISREISSLLPPSGTVLVVGLGNNDITPDAIGPRCAHQVLATRHISHELAEQSGLPSLRATCVLAPGVLGQTGIETCEIIRSITQEINPSSIVAIDALAARSVSRLGTTIQIASSGISPGSGVSNRRKELSRETLGVPVISIGIPTVVDASTLVADILDIDSGDLSEDQRQAFNLNDRPMMITPREIDLLISQACKILALVINKALHPEISFEDIAQLSS